jgi:hypothetical protein
MITAADIDTLLFDVLGTVVDEAGSMQAEVAAALGQADDSAQADALSSAWLRRASALIASICEGSPWRSTDDVNAEALAEVLSAVQRCRNLPSVTSRWQDTGSGRFPMRWRRSAGSPGDSRSWRCRMAISPC